MTAFDISPGSLASRVDELGTFGAEPDGGVSRFLYEDAWVGARSCVAEWMTDAGLDVRIDAAGNLFGRLEGTDASAPPILTGSHLDTVPHGGRFDGALGILSGLAALEKLASQGRPESPLEVVALCEEEASRFSANYWGTRAILGLIDPTELDTVVDRSGISMRDAMVSVGLDPCAIGNAHRGEVGAFIELHIEQGPVLASSGMQIGVVNRIVGFTRQSVTVVGQADHAGTTPMDQRRDALVGAAEMALDIRTFIADHGSEAVVTTGLWEVRPGAVNVVPGWVRFSVDLRHADDDVRRELVETVRRRCEKIAAQHRLSVELSTAEDKPAISMDPDLQALITDCATEAGLSSRTMASGAGHDAQTFARAAPAAMIFVPSRDGRSHSPAEHTDAVDAANGAGVLARVLHNLAYER